MQVVAANSLHAKFETRRREKELVEMLIADLVRVRHADLIVLVVTELGYLPPSSVPVVIREYRKEVTL